MTRESFLSKLNSLTTGNDIVDFIKQFAKPSDEIEKFINEYNPDKHDVFDKVKRPDKPVRKPTGYLDAKGNQVMATYVQPVTRIAIDAQQDITKNAAGILCANKIELSNAGTVQEIWDKNKLDLRTISICKYWLSETEVAELWYKKDGEDKVMILANSLGDTLYPVFDSAGDMVCFARSYTAKDVKADQIKMEDVVYFEIYLDSEVRKGDNSKNGTFVFDEGAEHGYNKIPIIYISRPLPIWSNVQTSICRFETSISNLCDTNDYFGSPTAVVKGKIISYADKGESGKILQMDPENADAEIKYLTWDQAPSSLQLEWENLQKIIYNSTRTVSLTIENLKGLFGSAPSAYAIKLLFTPAHLQAAEHEEVFGEYIQRRLNFLSGSKATITPKFTYYLPKNDGEELNNIIKAVNAGILSTESAVADSPLTRDIDIELKRLKDEQPAEDNTAGGNQPPTAVKRA